MRCCACGRSLSLSVYLTLRARKEPFCRDKHSTDIACRVKHNSETIRVSAVFTGHLEPRQWLLSPRHPDSASCATTRPHPLFSRSQAVCRKIKGARTRGPLLETKPRRIVIFRWRFRFSYSCCWGLGFALSLPDLLPFVFHLIEKTDSACALLVEGGMCMGILCTIFRFSPRALIRVSCRYARGARISHNFLAGEISAFTSRWKLSV